MAVLMNMENPTTTLRFGAPGESWRKSAQIPLVRDLELESEGLALEDLGNGHYVVRQLSEEAIQALREVDSGETTTYASAFDVYMLSGVPFDQLTDDSATWGEQIAYDIAPGEKQVWEPPSTDDRELMYFTFVCTDNTLNDTDAAYTVHSIGTAFAEPTEAGTGLLFNYYSTWRGGPEGDPTCTEIGGIVGIVLVEWTLFMHRQVRCTVLKSTLSFLILLLACKCLGEALAAGEFTFPVFWKGLILLGIWNRYCWYIPWVIRKRAGMRTASSR